MATEIPMVTWLRVTEPGGEPVQVTNRLPARPGWVYVESVRTRLDGEGRGWVDITYRQPPEGET